MDGKSNLIPLPQHANPDTVLTIDLKLAARSPDAKRLNIAAPVVAAPVMLAEWQLLPDEGQRLIYRTGTLAPAGGTVDVTGFAQIAQLSQGRQSLAAITSLLVALGFVALAIFVWRWAAGEGVNKFCVQHIFGAAVGLAAILFAVISLIHAASAFEAITALASDNLTFLAPVQQANSALTV